MNPFLIITCISPDTFIALIALLVSIASVYFVYKALDQQKIHNQNSVKPISFIAAGNYENCLYVSIENNGTGPLIIKELTVKNKTRTTSNVIDIIPDDLSKSIVFSKYTTNLSNRAILAGTELFLLEYRIDKELINEEPYKSHRTALRNALKNITIELTYTDIYGKVELKEERKMDWFGKNEENKN